MLIGAEALPRRDRFYRGTGFLTTIPSFMMAKKHGPRSHGAVQRSGRDPGSLVPDQFFFCCAFSFSIAARIGPNGPYMCCFWLKPSA